MQTTDTAGADRPEPRRADAAVVQQVDLSKVPAGVVLDPVEPAPEVDSHFAGWENPLAAAHRRLRSHIYVVAEGDGKVLEYDRERAGRSWPEGDRCLLTGEWTWQDYAISARVCVTGHFTTASADDSVYVRPAAGLVFRLCDIRRYYFLALEKNQRLVLYRRYDNEWTELAATRATTSPKIYSELRAVVRGNRIRCYLNGEQVFAVSDYRFPQGKAGVRFNVRARVDGLRVAMTPGQQHLNQRLAERASRERAELEAQLPKAQWVEAVPLPAGARLLQAVGQGDETRWLVLLRQDDTQALALLARKGEELWRSGTEVRDPSHDIAVSEPDDQGQFLIGLLSDGKIMLLDSESGRVRQQRQAPEVPGRQVSFTPLTACNVSGAEVARDFIVRDRISPGNSGEQVWAFNQDLDLLWSSDVRPNLGHQYAISSLDLDGDGREELLVGGTMLSADGERLWIMEGVEEVEETYQGHHIDSLVMGHFSGDEELDPLAFIMASSAGVYVLDALTGESIAVHRLGHAQGCSAGRFRPDLPGIQVVAGCRWGNYGLLACYSGRGEQLARFQPDYISQGGLPVNWTGDGQEHLLINSTPGAVGLYDGWGRRLLPLDQVETPDGPLNLSQGSVRVADMLGDPRDELIVQVAGKVHIFSAAGSLAAGRVYAPSRHLKVSRPGWQEWAG